MTTTAELIVLSSTKIKDSAIVLHTLSREFGRRSFLVSVGKSSQMAMFLPMNIIEATIVSNPKSDLWRASHFNCPTPLAGIRSSVSKNTMTLFLSEVLFRTLKDGCDEDGLFDWCKSSIMLLDSLERDFSNFHIRFLAEFASVLGFAPSMEDLMPFAGERYLDLKALVESSFGESMLLPLNGERRNEIADILIKYISHHSDTPLNIRSLAVLRELYR